MIISIAEGLWKTNVPFLMLISTFRFGLSAEFGISGVDIVCAFINPTMSASADQRSDKPFIIPSLFEVLEKVHRCH